MGNQTKQTTKWRESNDWKLAVANNQDSYGNAVIKVAERIMEILDTEDTPLKNGYGANTAYSLLCRADEEVRAGGITGFMAGCAANIIFQLHPRGNEFKDSFNGKNKCEGVINPAVITIEVNDKPKLDTLVEAMIS